MWEKLVKVRDEQLPFIVEGAGAEGAGGDFGGCRCDRLKGIQGGADAEGADIEGADEGGVNEGGADEECANIEGADEGGVDD